MQGDCRWIGLNPGIPEKKVPKPWEAFIKLGGIPAFQGENFPKSGQQMARQ